MTAPTDAAGIAARRAALRAVLEVETLGAWSNLAVPAAVAELDDARDRAFASHLAYETVRWRGTLDHVLGQVVTRPLDQVEPELLAVLRLGVVQLLRTDVPARAAVDTAVELARSSVPPQRAAGAGGFVNGVLRAVTRAEIVMPDPSDDPGGSLSLATAHPRWIVDELLERLGYDGARAALAADNEPPGVTLRANVDRDGLLDELHAAGIAAEAGALAPEAVRAPGADPRRLAAVREGRARVQDESSMLVVHATGVQPGDRVLDLCAGPGGKSTHLAQLAVPDWSVVAVEREAARADMIGAAAALSGTDVEVVVADAIDADVGDGYDVVLLDAPCSGLGVGRRRP
ncbi:MAG TPA: transcription antitermination factor NusB, partial [Solirubrobacteraceae bacterium]|nr:transcription antitermination factor NusB [Solirubrobacteraceae bacterium]